MQSFALPAVTRAHPPDIADARSARDWLSGADVSQPMLAQAQLLGQLNLLNRHAVPAGERLRIAEELRDTVVQIQSTTANRFVGRPLPLSASERTAFDANQGLWDTLVTAYLHCLAAALDGDGAVVGQAGLIAHRALCALALMQLDALRTAHTPAPGYWRRVHAAFDAAERLGASERKFRDGAIHDERPTSVRAAYALCLLLHASSPYSLTHRQLRVMHRWLGKWSGKVALFDSPVPHSALPPLMVDLKDDAPVSHTPRADSRLRWLVLDELSHSVRKRLNLLAQGETPLALRLGDELSPTQAERLLRHLHAHCCRGGMTRSEPRRQQRQAAAVVIGMGAVQQFLSGEDIARFGAAGDTQAAAFRVEDWHILDDSPTGLRLGRRAGSDCTRVGNGMLLAVRPDDTGRFMLAHVCWVMASGGEIQMGISMIAGAPQPVTLARLPGEGGEHVAFGLLVPEVARIGQPECIALPTGWYRKARDITLGADGAHRRVRLVESIERGSDFDLARIESLA